MLKTFEELIIGTTLGVMLFLCIYVGFLNYNIESKNKICKEKNSSFKSGLYSENKDSPLKLKVDGLNDLKIISDSAEFDINFFNPFRSNSCHLFAEKNFKFQLLFDNLPALYIHFSGIFGNSKGSEKIDFDNLFKEILLKERNWKVVFNQDNAVVYSNNSTRTIFEVVMGEESSAFIETPADFYVYHKKDGWKVLDFNSPMIYDSISDFLKKKNLIDRKSYVLEFSRFSEDENLILNLIPRSDFYNKTVFLKKEIELELKNNNEIAEISKISLPANFNLKPKVKEKNATFQLEPKT